MCPLNNRAYSINGAVVWGISIGQIRYGSTAVCGILARAVHLTKHCEDPSLLVWNAVLTLQQAGIHVLCDLRCLYWSRVVVRWT